MDVVVSDKVVGTGTVSVMVVGSAGGGAGAVSTTVVGTGTDSVAVVD
jgi:hypothetical protein